MGNGLTQAHVRHFSKAKNKHPRILDVGCGAGYDSYILNRLGAKVVGVDFSENLIEVAKKSVKNCDFYIKNIENSLIDLGYFDGIFCTSVLNYVDITKLKLVFENFSKIMKNGSLLFISILDGNGKNEQKSFSIIDGEEYDLNFSNMSAEQLCSFAKPDLKLIDTFMFDDFSKGYRYYVFIKKQ